MSEIPTQDGIYGGISDASYHADRGSLSFSGAKLLLPPSCPAKFRYHMDNPPTPKPEYTFGHAVHRLVLGEGSEIVEVDAPDWRSKEAREIRATACNGVAPMLKKELDVAKQMADKVHEHPIAGPLFAEGQAEMSLYSNDPVHGVRLRGRTDWMTSLDDRLVIVDYKSATTVEPKAFARKAFEYAYFMQCAWYLDLVMAAELDESPAFLTVAQEKEPPFLVEVMEYDADAIDEGRRLNQQAIALYAACRKRDEWPGYSTRIRTISLPPWAFHQPTLNDL